MYKRRLTILICTLVIVGLLFAPFSLSARAIAGIDDALAGGLFLGFLAAMGLDFSFIGVDQNKEGIVNILQDLYDDFRASQNLPLIALASAWALLRESVLTGGTVSIPQSVAEDMVGFTDYIIDEYSLDVNSSALVDTINGYFLTDGTLVEINHPFQTNTYYTLQSGNSFGCFQRYADQPRSYQFRFIIDGQLVNGSSGTFATSVPETVFAVYGWNSSHTFDGRSVIVGTYNENAGVLNGGGYYWSLSNSGITLASLAGDALYRETYITARQRDRVPSGVASDVYVTVPGVTDVFGGSVEGVADQILEAACDEDLEASYEITDEPPVYPDPDGPTILNVFTDQIGSFFDTIWHYVSDLVDYSTPFIIVWRDQLMGAFPFRIMLPLYASFVLALFLGLYKVFRGVH